MYGVLTPTDDEVAEFTGQSVYPTNLVMDGTQVRRATATVLRAEKEGDHGIAEAIVSAWDVEYNVGWGFKEEIARGAFEGDPNLPTFYEHDWMNAPIGFEEKTEVRGEGQFVRVRFFIDVDPFVARVFAALEHRSLKEWSVGFIPLERKNPEADGRVDRMKEIITKARRLESSVVVMGANPKTKTMKVRSKRPESEERQVDEFAKWLEGRDWTDTRTWMAIAEERRRRADAQAAVQ